MNTFEIADEPNGQIIFLEIWREEEALIGKVTVPAYGTGGKIAVYPVREMPAQDAYAFAIYTAKRHELPIGVKAAADVWPTKWGRLVRSGTQIVK